MSGENEALLAQPIDLRDVKCADRDMLVIAMRRIDGAWVATSRYGDDVWELHGVPTNVRRSDRQIDFTQVPHAFRTVAKETAYRFMRRGRRGRKRPGASAVCTYFRGIVPFTRYLEELGIKSLSAVTPIVCLSYADKLKGGIGAKGGKPSPNTVSSRLGAIEALFELSQHCVDVMTSHPWPESSAHHISGQNKYRLNDGRRTPLIPPAKFAQLFQAAWCLVEEADRLFLLRDATFEVARATHGLTRNIVNYRKNAALERMGWAGGVGELQERLLLLRTACYVVIASLSGCRNHELAFLQAGCAYKSEDEAGATYWWMRSKSTKTNEGRTQWMIPEAAVRAIEVMERWAVPYQAQLESEIGERRRANSTDLGIADCEDHLHALFVGVDIRHGGIVRTVSVSQWNVLLKKFADDCGLELRVSTHQFRRTFANYAARSQFGDLRYLKEHFKHWSLDMTLGYAMNEDQEMALYLEIQDELDDIKEGVVTEWMSETSALGGGYGKNLVKWRSRTEQIVMFKSVSIMIKSIAESTAIRSNGHAWCTSDNHDCPGNDTDPLRCGDDCSNAVVGEQHKSIYEGLYSELDKLKTNVDIGRAGVARVERDLRRCRHVLTQLGHNPIGAEA